MSTAQHAVGLPVWIELASDDVDVAVKFYEQLFGWESKVLPQSDANARQYVIMSNNGRVVAAIASKMNPGQPTMWLTYLESDNLEQTMAKVSEAGGATYMPVMPVPGGHFTVASGAALEPLGLFQPEAGEQGGFEAFGRDPGDLVWFELESTKPAKDAAAFYQKVFGWELAPVFDTDDSAYITFMTPGKPAAGGVFSAKIFPTFLNIQSQWAPVFATTDIDATAAKVKELGGMVGDLQKGTPYGDFVMCRDAQKALFIAMRPQMPA